MKKAQANLEGLGTALLAGILVLVLARLLVLVLLHAVYATLPKLLWWGTGTTPLGLTVYDILRLLLNRWVWTVYLLWGGVAGLVTWFNRDASQSRKQQMGLRVCFALLLLTSGWVLWLGGVIGGILFAPPPEGVLRPALLSLAGLAVEPVVTATAILRLPRWLEYLCEPLDLFYLGRQ